MKVYQQIIFWIAVYGSLTLIFTNWFGSRLEAFYYVSMLMPVVIATSYFFNYYLVPAFLFRRKFLQFGLYSIYMLVISLCLELVAGILAMILIIKMGISQAGAVITDVFTLAGILYFVVLMKSFILLIRNYFLDQNAIRRLEERQELAKNGFLSVRSNRMQSRVRFDDLVYLESLADYIRLHLEDGSAITSREKISHMESLLPEGFIRIHRSFIVNRMKIVSYNREHVVLKQKELPVSRTYRKVVMEKLQSSSILASS